ncbi:MAG TPA: hypothetical protein VF692_00155 [Pyrinomonadaceae bacterium]|jgi:hypothetical protein
MSKFANPLNNIKIASPCPADWNEMIGDERKRYCSDCKLNVYNLSEMTKAQAENLIIESEGSLCVRFYRRADGTVLTKDCPVGWQMIKKRISQKATAFASFLFAVLGGLGSNAFFNRAENPAKVGTIAVQNIEAAPIVNQLQMEKIETVEIMGAYISEAPEAGGIGNIEEVRQKVRKSRRR